MHAYGARDVEKLLGLPRSTIRALVNAGFVTPARGPRNSWRFSFQDMIVLRTAQALSQAKVPAKRITRSLQALRRQLPESMPLSGISIGTVGDQVVVRDASGRRQADNGQYLLAFEGDPATGSLSVLEPKCPPQAGAADTALDWFEKAGALELEDTDAALAAYRRAIERDPELLGARINLGRLLHESGRHADAESVYREALERCGEDALLCYNLGVLLDELDRPVEALEAYRSALRLDAAFADCCYNLSLLCRRLGRPQEALRYMSQYRRLLGAPI